MKRIDIEPGSRNARIEGDEATRVVGTNADETVTVAASAHVEFDPSFNRGGDEIVLEGEAASYEGRVEGSNLVLDSASGGEVSIPFGSSGTLLTFDDGSRILRFDGEGVNLGSQQMSGFPAVLDSLDAAPPLSSSDILLGSNSTDFG